MDYGTVDEVFVDDIRLMRRDCVELLPQAFRGCLDNIRPSDGLWTRQATKTFKNVVQNINVYANVTAIDTDVRIFLKKKKKTPTYIRNSKIGLDK